MEATELGPSLPVGLRRKQREEIIISQWYKGRRIDAGCTPCADLLQLQFQPTTLYYSFGFFNWSGCGVYREPDWMPPSPFSAAALPLHSAIFAFPFFHCVYFGLRVQNWYRATRQASGSSLLAAWKLRTHAARDSWIIKILESRFSVLCLTLDTERP